MSQRLSLMLFAFALAVPLAGCERAPADALGSETAIDAAPSDGCLAMLSPPSPEVPLASVQQHEFDAPPIDAATRDCLARTFGDTIIATPQAYDRGYARVQSQHGEFAELRWDDMPHARLQLLRLVQTGAYGLWLLRIDTGLAMEGARYDVLFSSGPQEQLIDTLLVGVEGTRVRRDVDLRERGAFVLREHAGREGVDGVGYVGAFHVDEVGRFVHDADGDVTPLAPQRDGDVSAQDAFDEDTEAESLLLVQGHAGDVEPVRTVLFSDSGVLEEFIEPRTLGDGTPVLLAIGRSDVAAFVVYLLVPDGTASGAAAQYRVASRVLSEPADVLDGRVAIAAWEPEPRSRRVHLALDVTHDVIQPGGDPATGEPASTAQQQRVALLYDPDSGRWTSDNG